jgi:predicted transcriptional regulator
MRNIKIRQLMTPIADYKTINEDKTLYDVFQILETDTPAGKSGHRDLIVLDSAGNFKGKVTMLDIFKALEPNYKKLDRNITDGFLTRDYILNAVKEFDLWLEPVKDLCERGSGMKISTIMHTPKAVEYVDEQDSLEKALHKYVAGVHQPLIVRQKDHVTGILRFESLYEVIREHMLACKL